MKISILILLLSVFSFGCGSSKNTIRGAAWCDTQYEVSTFKNVNATASTKLEEDTVLDLTAGTYELETLDVFFHDSNRDIRMHVRYITNELDENGKAIGKVQCVASDSGQINSKMQPYFFEIDVFSKIIVADSSKTSLGDGTATIEFKYVNDDTPILKTPEYNQLDTEPSEKNLKDTFKAGFNKTEQHLFTLPQAYEMQNKLEATGLKIETKQLWKLKP